MRTILDKLQEQIATLQSQLDSLKGSENPKKPKLKKDGQPKKTGRKIEASTSKNARLTGQLLEEMVLLWCLRWHFVTDQTLEFLYPARPRLAYDMSRRGILKKHQILSGEKITLRDNSGHAYGLSDSAKIRIMDEYETFSAELEKHPKIPNWKEIQHLLDLQKIVAKYLGLPDLDLSKKINFVESKSWQSEPETRQKNQSAIVPDFLIWGEDHDQERLEYDQNPKNDLALKFWIRQLISRVSLPYLQSNPDSREYIAEEFKRVAKITKITIIVRTQHQCERYSKFFESNALDYVAKDSQRKYYVRQDMARLNPKTAFKDLGCKIEISTLNEFLYAD